MWCRVCSSFLCLPNFTFVKVGDFPFSLAICWPLTTQFFLIFFIWKKCLHKCIRLCRLDKNKRRLLDLPSLITIFFNALIKTYHVRIRLIWRIKDISKCFLRISFILNKAHKLINKSMYLIICFNLYLKNILTFLSFLDRAIFSRNKQL